MFVSDIATDPLWADFKDLALEHGLRLLVDPDSLGFRRRSSDVRNV